MNPTGQPFDPYPGAPPPPGVGGTGAREQLSVPAILLMLGGALGVLNVLASVAMQPLAERYMRELAGSQPAALQEAITQALATSSGVLSKVLNIVASALSGLMIYGAWQMKNLKSYPLAFTAAVLGLIPGNCCCLTLPVGIWAIVVLLKPEVKAEFR